MSNTDLREFSDADLREELAQRERRQKMLRPLPVVNDELLQGLVKMCDDHLTDIENGKEDDDTPHYIYEAAMEMVFGENIFKDYINPLL